LIHANEEDKKITNHIVFGCGLLYEAPLFNPALLKYKYSNTETVENSAETYLRFFI
jgi:hypothetical protein